MREGELKPCPFCGNIIEGYLSNDMPDKFSDMNLFKCTSCGARITFIRSTDQEAIEAWNRRISDATSTK
jgi:Lar family restriction alleviation protein